MIKEKESWLDETRDVSKARGSHCVRFEAGENQDKAWKNWLTFGNLPRSVAQAC